MARQEFKWTEHNVDKLTKVRDVLEELSTYKPLTLRQIYYQLVGKGFIENNKSQYVMLSKLLKWARIDGHISWSDIEDRTRDYHGSGGSVNVDSFIENEIDGLFKYYSRNLAQTQPKYIEIWIEKDALSSIFTSVARRYYVPVTVCRGFSSVSFLNDFKNRFKNPILIDDNFEIIAGHTRLLAAKKLGLKEVPTIKIDDLSPEQVKAFRIADNKTTEYADWNLELLAHELEDLKLTDYDLSLTGFDLSEAEKLLDTLKEGYDGDNPDDNFDGELPEDPISRLGDLWILGKHKLMCGDSTKGDDVAVLMEDDKADMVFTDPPWNVNYGADMEHPSWKPRTIMNDSMSTDDFKEFMNSTFSVMRKFSKVGCMTYIVMSQQEWGNLMLTMKDNEYHWSSTIIWKKDFLVLSRKDFNTIYEGIWYGWLEGAARLHPVTNMKECDCWEIPRYKVSIYHPTQKPVDLIIRAIKNSSNMKDIVLDLFGGSGTTLIACEETERICRMMELDPKYVDVIVKRFIDKVDSEDDVFVLRDGQQYKYSDLKCEKVA